MTNGIFFIAKQSFAFSPTKAGAFAELIASLFVRYAQLG
jgi:hypothetical protein